MARLVNFYLKNEPSPPAARNRFQRILELNLYLEFDGDEGSASEFIEEPIYWLARLVGEYINSTPVPMFTFIQFDALLDATGEEPMTF